MLCLHLIVNISTRPELSPESSWNETLLHTDPNFLGGDVTMWYTNSVHTRSLRSTRHGTIAAFLCYVTPRGPKITRRMKHTSWWAFRPVRYPNRPIRAWDIKETNLYSPTAFIHLPAFQSHVCLAVVMTKLHFPKPQLSRKLQTLYIYHGFGQNYALNMGLADYSDICTHPSA